MINRYDDDIRTLIEGITPDWRDFRVGRLEFSILDPVTIRTSGVLLVGKPSLLLFTTSRDLTYPRVEFFPINAEVVDATLLDHQEWLILEPGGILTDLGWDVSWLFRNPRLRLIETAEDVADGIGAQARRDTLLFFGGVEARVRRVARDLRSSPATPPT